MNKYLLYVLLFTWGERKNIIFEGINKTLLTLIFRPQLISPNVNVIYNTELRRSFGNILSVEILAYCLNRQKEVVADQVTSVCYILDKTLEGQLTQFIQRQNC